MAREPVDMRNYAGSPVMRSVQHHAALQCGWHLRDANLAQDIINADRRSCYVMMRRAWPGSRRRTTREREAASGRTMPGLNLRVVLEVGIL